MARIQSALLQKSQAPLSVRPLMKETHVRARRVLMAFRPEVNGLIRSIAELGASLSIGWNELGYGALAAFGEIFTEFARDRGAVQSLATSTASPFNPGPGLRHFAGVDTRSALLLRREEQLRTFSESLT